MKTTFISLIIFSIFLLSCSDNESNDCCVLDGEPKLIVKFKFDPDQVRLNSFGQPSTMPNENAAQTPNFKLMSANYIEFAPSATTLLGNGEVIYLGKETRDGGELAIDFREAILAENGDVFLEIPLAEVSPGDYNWVRVSLSYQQGDIDILIDGNELKGTLAGFLGYNTYIPTFQVNGVPITVNSNKKQGYWAFETLGVTVDGQAPEGATTVPNPIFDTSPVPQGSCVITGQFENGLQISGNEITDKVVTLSFSINKSFEWKEINFDGKYEPIIGEQVVDMGLRGLIPIVEQ